VVHGGEQVDLAAVVAFGAAQRLAVDRDRTPTLIMATAVGQPRADRGGERLGIQPCNSSLGDRSATAEGATAVAAFSRRPYPDRAVEPDRPWEYGGTAMRLRLGRAACVVGWSGPGNQVKGGDTW
jgi:hypothetical protein